MDHEPKTPQSPPAGTAPPESQDNTLTQDQREEIVRLHQQGFGTRRIHLKLDVSRGAVRALLRQLGYLKPPQPLAPGQKVSKLDLFREQIKQKVEKKLTSTRILREIRARGYSGGRTILADYVRVLRPTRTPRKKSSRRFETRPGEEMQADWSSYLVPLGGRQRLVHAFAAILAFSRKEHVRFYPDEREATLLTAHTYAFEDFGGLTQRIVYDRMATVVLGTIGRDREPLWHPRFKDFSQYYGFKPFLCAVADPDRKGKDERVFWHLEQDFVRDSEFDSFEDLNAKVRLWLDRVANPRLHGTTRRVPDQVFQDEERPFLIALPEGRFATYDEEPRQVDEDSVIWIRGTPYTIPARQGQRSVRVRLYPDHFEVLGQADECTFSRPYVDAKDKGRLQLDPSHYEKVRPRTGQPWGSGTRLEETLLKRFPDLEELVCGLKLRMKSLAHVHLRALLRLAERYGDQPFHEAALRAQTFRRFDAHAVSRLLECAHPLPPEEPTPGLNAAARVLLEIGEVDGGSLEDYAHLDSAPSTPAKPGSDSEGGSDAAQ